jgi:hypothetical protein
LKKLLLKRSLNVPEEAIKAYQTKYYIEKEKAKSNQEKQKELKDK